MNLSTLAGTSALALFTIFIISFVYWWAFFEEETDEFDADMPKGYVDPLQVLPIFVEIQLRKVFLLYVQCHLLINEVSSIKDSIREHSNSPT